MAFDPRLQKLLKWIGYPLFAIFAFVVCLYVTFPYDKVKRLLEGQASASGEMEVSIGSVGPRPLFGLTLSDVTIRVWPKPKPRFPGVPAPAEDAKQQKPRILTIERVAVSTGLLAALSGGVDLSFVIDGLGGRVEGSYVAQKKRGWAAEVELRNVSLGQIPQVAQAVGLPVKGSLSGQVKLNVPLHRLSEATGQIDVACDGCSVGDGKAKLKVPGNPLLAMGITLPRVRLGRLGGQIKIEKGLASFENVSAKSPDIELALEGTLRLRKPAIFSTMDGYLRFKISPELKRRDAKFEIVENGLANAKRTDGFFGMRMTGTLRRLQTRPSRLGLPRRDATRASPRRRFGPR